MGTRQTYCEQSERATEKPENGSGRKFYILWIWDYIPGTIGGIEYLINHHVNPSLTVLSDNQCQLSYSVVRHMVEAAPNQTA